MAKKITIPQSSLLDAGKTRGILEVEFIRLNFETLGRVYNQHFKTEKRPVLSHSGRRPGIQKQNTHWIPVFTGMTTVVSVLFVQM